VQTRSITAFKFARLWPPSVSPNSVDHGLQVHLQTHTITASKVARSRHPGSHDHGLEAHPHTRSMTISECISKFTRSWRQSASPNQLDYQPRVHLQTRSITASVCTSVFNRSSFSGAPRIALMHHLQPVQIYRV